MDLNLRIGEHFDKKYSGFTSHADDWEIFLSISDLEYKQARKIEDHIKKMKSKKYIENLQKYSSLRNKLVEKYRE